MKFNEPSAHLDHLAKKLLGLEGMHPEAPVLGLSAKDKPLLDAMAALGHRKLLMVDPARDLGYRGPTAGVAWLQDRFDEQLAKNLLARFGRPFLVVARHYLEHLSRLPETIAVLRSLLDPAGFAIFEVPDCEMPMRWNDACMLWEEHQLYFTSTTLRTSLQALGLGVEQILSYPSLGETCLVAATSFRAGHRNLAQNEAGLFEKFVEGILAKSASVRERLREWRRSGPLALYGAGHHANTFLTFHDLHREFDCVLDDDPHKANSKMPGSTLPIVTSSWLDRTAARVCFSSLAFEIEGRVAAKHPSFLASGGHFVSIFPEREDQLFRPVKPMQTTNSTP